eukprot:5158080-Alexandrium_andersonii.AAC.1
MRWGMCTRVRIDCFARAEGGPQGSLHLRSLGSGEVAQALVAAHQLPVEDLHVDRRCLGGDGGLVLLRRAPV